MINNDNLLLQGMLSVSELTELIKQTLEGGFYNLQVTGEVSGFRPSSTGHWYFKLKDNKASIDAVMFRGNTFRVTVPPKDGDEITVTGSISVYAPRGTYQIKVDSIVQTGLGDILRQLEERKQRYSQLGWFDQDRKQPICRFPQRLGVITSPTAAALQDILQVTARRAPDLDIIIIPATVQGKEAAASITNAIHIAEDLKLCDQLIIARGGGSVEDLLPFSDETVLQAILACTIPVITGVGHEIDWALCDYVADMRAPTPSAAAELATKGIFEARQQRESVEEDLKHSIQNKLLLTEQKLHAYDRQSLSTTIRSRLDSCQLISAGLERDMELYMERYFNTRQSKLQQYDCRNLAKALLAQLEGQQARCKLTAASIAETEQNLLKSLEHRIRLSAGIISSLGPQGLLDKGYAIVSDHKGQIVKSCRQAKPGTNLTLKLSDGSRQIQVKEDR
ncbi:MAG: exodeoxyribonuclease VII large subunit [Spirochaetia bacterium]|nr:exodeoxyribonuclease VII large subunit [Spirochaetia bacterium]